jgi:serine/threonine protein kinase
MDLRPRAVGVRIRFASVSPSVRSWLAARFGPVEVVAEHIGGMSPGCATTLQTLDDGRIFVKAVGVELNPDTPNLFRREISVLSKLPPAPYRTRLLDFFDDDGWVAVVLEDVPGRVPDLADPHEFAAVASVVHRQVEEFTPAPPGIDVPTLESAVRRWLTRWDDLSFDPGRVLPSWALARFDELHDRVRSLAGRTEATSLCHFDTRDDNLLIRDDGQIVILDWGMPCLGPAWLDVAYFALQSSSADLAEQRLREWINIDDQETVTSFVVAFAGSQAWVSIRTPPKALPTLPEFCAADAERCFAVAELRV